MRTVSSSPATRCAFCRLGSACRRQMKPPVVREHETRRPTRVDADSSAPQGSSWSKAAVTAFSRSHARQVGFGILMLSSPNRPKPSRPLPTRKLDAFLGWLMQNASVCAKRDPSSNRTFTSNAHDRRSQRLRSPPCSRA